jgi:uncharacterized protein YndB with AHSA1/START domain
MAEYRFLTVWVFDTPIEQVWQAIFDLENWSSWWPAVESAVEIQPTLANRIGSIWQVTWKMPLGYQLAVNTTLQRIEPFHELAAIAQGKIKALAATGLWQLATVPEGTLVQHHWGVKTTSLWMNILLRLLRPAIAWNHNQIMEHGGQKLAQYLQGRLISSRYTRE